MRLTQSSMETLFPWRPGYSLLEGSANFCFDAGLVGIFSAALVRAIHHVPANYKISSRLVSPLFPSINQAAHRAMIGPGKYLISLLPMSLLIAGAAKESWDNHSWQPLKRALLSYEMIFTVTTLTLTILFSMTWPLVFSSLSLTQFVGDFSEHTFFVLSFAALFSVAKQELSYSNHWYQELLSIAAVVVGVATGVLIFNTVYSYHTIRESLAALVSAVALLQFSHHFARALKH